MFLQLIFSILQKTSRPFLICSYLGYGGTDLRRVSPLLSRVTPSIMHCASFCKNRIA